MSPLMLEQRWLQAERNHLFYTNQLHLRRWSNSRYLQIFLYSKPTLSLQTLPLPVFQNQSVCSHNREVLGQKALPDDRALWETPHVQRRNRNFPIWIIPKIHTRIKTTRALEKCANTEPIWDLCERQKLTSWKSESLGKLFYYYGTASIY